MRCVPRFALALAVSFTSIAATFLPPYIVDFRNSHPDVSVHIKDGLRDEVDATDRPCVPPLAEAPDPGAVQALFELLKQAASPVAIVGGADWSPRAAHHFANRVAALIKLP